MAELATNIYLYALDKQQLQERVQRPDVHRSAEREDADVEDDQGVRLEYGGNWNPEPGGWRRLANFIHNDGGRGSGGDDGEARGGEAHQGLHSWRT